MVGDVSVVDYNFEDRIHCERKDRADLQGECSSNFHDV